MVDGITPLNGPPQVRDFRPSLAVGALLDTLAQQADHFLASAGADGYHVAVRKTALAAEFREQGFQFGSPEPVRLVERQNQGFLPGLKIAAPESVKPGNAAAPRRPAAEPRAAP